MTADVIQASNEHCIKCGMDDYVSKPFEEEQLYSAVARFFESSWKKQESYLSLGQLQFQLARVAQQLSSGRASSPKQSSDESYRGTYSTLNTQEGLYSEPILTPRISHEPIDLSGARLLKQNLFGCVNGHWIMPWFLESRISQKWWLTLIFLWQKWGRVLRGKSFHKLLLHHVPCSSLVTTVCGQESSGYSASWFLNSS